jgi:hypothetical protein
MKTYKDFVSMISEEFEKTIIEIYYKKYKSGLTWFEWLTIPKKSVVLQLIEQECENEEVLETQIFFCFNYWTARNSNLKKVKSGNEVIKLNEISDWIYLNKINDVMLLLTSETEEESEEESGE